MLDNIKKAKEELIKVKHFFKETYNKHIIYMYITVALLVNLIIEMLARGSFLKGIFYLISSPYVFICNSIIILMTLSVTLLMRRRFFGISIISIVWIIFGIANCVLLSYRVTPFTAVDMMLIDSALDVMNKYLNTAKLYLKADIADDKLTQYVSRDLNIHTDVDFHNVVVDNNIAKATTFYNFANYTLLAIIIVVVSMVMISFNEEKIRRRNLVSSISYQSFNRQLLLGNIITSIGVWSLYVIASFALYGATMLTNAGLLLILNSFVLVIFILVFSFFLTTVTHNRELVSGISTVVGLGTSFIAGAFVPQEFLAPFVLNIAKLTPSYWFIDGNNKIASLSGYSWTELQPIIMNMAIILGFAVLFYILIQLVSRLKLKKS